MHAVNWLFDANKALQPTYGAFQIDKNGYDIHSMYQNSIVFQT